MSGDHSVSAARNSSTQFSTGGGDERVAFKFGAGHAHWLTVTRHVTDLQLRERRLDRDRPIINTAGPRSAGRSTVRFRSSERPASRRYVANQRTAGSATVSRATSRPASSSAEREAVLSLKPSGRATETGHFDDVSTLYLNNTPRR